MRSKTMAESIEQKLAELAAQADHLREKRTRLDDRLAQLLAEISALRKTAAVFGFEIEARPTPPAANPATRVGRRKAILDVLLETTEPGQEIGIQELVERVVLHPGMGHLSSRTPGATIATAISRAGEHFERVRAGVYRRTRHAADDDDS